MGTALVAMIIAMVWAGVPVGAVEAVIFTGIALAALIFTIILFQNIKE
jgi:hypothetical protein